MIAETNPPMTYYDGRWWVDYNVFADLVARLDELEEKQEEERERGHRHE